MPSMQRGRPSGDDSPQSWGPTGESARPHLAGAGGSISTSAGLIATTAPEALGLGMPRSGSKKVPRRCGRGLGDRGAALPVYMRRRRRLDDRDVLCAASLLE